MGGAASVSGAACLTGMADTWRPWGAIGMGWISHGPAEQRPIMNIYRGRRREDLDGLGTGLYMTSRSGSRMFARAMALVESRREQRRSHCSDLRHHIRICSRPLVRRLSVRIRFFCTRLEPLTGGAGPRGKPWAASASVLLGEKKAEINEALFAAEP